MRVNCNISAIIANNQLGNTEDILSQSIERLSSGLRINHASDDSSGMAVSKKMHTQIKALERASSNTTDGVSVVQTAEASLGEVENILQRMRELAVQSASDTNTDSDRVAIQSEIESLQKEIDRISTDTEFNTMPLLDGTLRRRAYADTDGVKMTQIATGVADGEYSFSVTAEAKYATADLSIASLVGTSGNITVNSVLVEIKDTDTAQDIYSNLADAANKAGLTLEIDNINAPDNITFTQKTAGSGYCVEIGASEEFYGVAQADGKTLDQATPKTTEYGEDAKVALNRSSDFSNTAGYTAEGNWITVRDVNNFEMTFEIPVDAVLSDCTFKITSIGTMGIQVGANDGQRVDIDIPEINCHTLRIDQLNVGCSMGASQAIEQLDHAIERVSSTRSKLGAYQNRLETTQNNLGTYTENLTIALSGIEDCDMAEEMTRFTTHNVKTQAATSVLAQANERPQTVLQLLQ